MFRSTVSKQDRELVMMVRDLAQSQIATRVLDYDLHQHSNYNWAPLNLLAQHNLMALNIPQEYGGMGLSHLTTAMVLEEIASASAGVATVVATNLHAASPIMTSGNEEQRKKYLPLLADKTPKLAAVALIEHRPNLDIIAQPEAMDIRASSVNLENMDGGIIKLKGIKDYVTNAPFADFAVVMLSTSPRGEKSKLQVAIVPFSTPGVVIGQIRKQLGLRYCLLSELIFDSVKVEKKDLIGKPGSGFLVFMQNLDRCNPLVGAISVGVARAAYETALEASKKRMLLGKPSFEKSVISFALTDMATKINAARQSVHLACWLIDQDSDCSQAASKAKIISSSVAQEVTSRAMEIVGGRAYLYGHKSEIYLRDAKMLSIIDGSEQFHRNLVASQL